MLLDDDDLAYMRETQTEVRPTAADWFRRTGKVPDGMGGYASDYPDNPEPVAIRLTKVTDNTSSDDVPADLAGRYRATDLLKVHADLVALAEGDRLVVGQQTYQVVTNAEPMEWTTALIAWAVEVGDPT